MTLGSLYLFVSYIEQINQPIHEITNFLSKYTRSIVSMERIEELYQKLLGFEETGGVEAPVVQQTVISFSDVGFAYPNSEKAIFDGLSLQFNAGESVALIGPSGAGKSTFIRLLNRLYDPVEGSVEFNGIPMPAVDIAHLRGNIRVISQENFIFSGTVRENLFALQSDSDDSLWEALKAVHADEFVKSLPSGLDTQIGEGGHGLSGGQMRRISLARAFVSFHETHVYVFDEPSSGLDPESAEVVMQSAQALAQKGKSVIWSTHRMSEVQVADRVLFFQPNANPVLSSHAELFEDHAGYRELLQKEGL